MSTLLPSTSTGKWAGFQILTGAGRGIVQQLVGNQCCISEPYLDIIPANCNRASSTHRRRNRHWQLPARLHSIPRWRRLYLKCKLTVL